MPKNATYPFLFDEEKSISISNLRKWDYLQMNKHRSGTITWSRNGIKISQLSIQTFLAEQNSYVMLDYKCNDTSYNYKIPLITLPSNLGTGNVWYFICPFTNKRCRILHLIDERFMHRSALPSGMYSKQTETKKWRQMKKVYGAYFDTDKCYEEIYSKHFKKYYKGKPTKRYLKLLQKINEAEKVTVSEIENLFYM